jgi:hypothetical protein
MAKMRANGRDIIASKTENRTMMGTSNRANKSHIGEVRRTKNLRKVFIVRNFKDGNWAILLRCGLGGVKNCTFR